MSGQQLRLVDQEPDCIAIVPEHPDYVIFGTYSLIEGNESATSAEQRRKGSLQIIPFDKTNSYNVDLTRLDFDFGIYDLQLHPTWQNELGIATSHGEIWFYSIEARYDKEHGYLRSLELRLNWRLPIEPRHPDTNQLPIITQFQFLDMGEKTTPLLAATSSFGKTRLVKAPVNGHNPSLEQNQLVHSHREKMEAWATATVIDKDNKRIFILSGGDDARLIISSVYVPTLADTDAKIDIMGLNPVRTLTDRSSHGAGIVSICNIGRHPMLAAGHTSKWAKASGTLILTGSYDEHMRLFLLKPPKANGIWTSSAFENLCELNLGSAVWRIIRLDHYASNEGNEHRYILLIGGHLGGALLVSLGICRDALRDSDWEYDLHIEKHFGGHGHESLVYAVAGKQDTVVPKRWNLISASFYDKKVCNWTWLDEEKRVRSAAA